ncbi:MAG TPA: ABC transporter permease [Polyangia bacterium]|nr:ABC transporter permease [Polyangia bacterium]
MEDNTNKPSAPPSPGVLPQPAAPAPPAEPRPPVKTEAADKPSRRGSIEVRSRESIWALRKALPQRHQMAFRLALPLLLLGIWCALTMGSRPAVGPLFLPSPTGVMRGFASLFFRDQCEGGSCSLWQSYLLRCIGTSSLRIFLSFGIAALAALPLGILMGAWEPVNRLFDPVMAPLRYLPISAFIPLLILWLGIGETQKIAFLVLGVFVYLLPVVVTAIRAVPEELVETAYTLGASRLQVIRTVLLPAALPDIFDSFRVMNAIAWTYVILAEFVNAQVGLGYMIDLSGKHLKTDEVFAGIAVIGVIGLATDALIRAMNGVLFRWHEAES